MTGQLREQLDHELIFGLHANSIVIDKKITVIGVFNPDPRSTNVNNERIVIVNSVSISVGVLNGMIEEFNPENSWETTLDFNPDSKDNNWQRLKTWTREVLPTSILFFQLLFFFFVVKFNIVICLY